MSLITSVKSRWTYITFVVILGLSLTVFTIERNMSKLVSVDFEVFGRVQGVFFRKYTKNEATKLKLTGYCMNTDDGTVKGTMEGPISEINKMKEWLQKVGSPSSQIDKAIFTNEKEITKNTYGKFEIKR